MNYIVLVLLIAYQQVIYAFDWDDLWLRKDQQRAEVLSKAVSFYKDKKYQDAIEIWEPLDSAMGYYNKANALVHLSRFKEAIVSYKKVLALDPNYPDVKANLAIAEKLLQQFVNKKPTLTEKPKKPNKDKGAGANEKNPPKNSKKSAANKSPKGEAIAAKNAPIIGQQRDSKSKKQLQSENKKKTVQDQEQFLQSIDDNPKELWRKKIRSEYENI
ncbi:tetratricopeptide repeat protein [Candidatus Marithrix sp. Canyon 246]|uniref:tetratricopeptide repeat protein n=1 Tax=Candidatus Marithrix sp. Canyon 246 TaxID=1827136 RepID=UPI000849F87B|nr:tetratricopeptide repeat protein [Candidatus Marithrix sp. Canyon 246]